MSKFCFDETGKTYGFDEGLADLEQYHIPEIEEAIINFRSAVEKVYGQPVIEAKLDFSQVWQGVTFKDSSGASIVLNPKNVYGGDWVKYHHKVTKDQWIYKQHFFFWDEIRRGDHEKWLAECRKAEYKNPYDGE